MSRPRDVLGVASVIGIGFGLAELEDLLGEPIPPGTLDRLVDAALIVPSARNGTWRFSHPLVHEAAYAGMLASRRRRLHARLADRLEAEAARLDRDARGPSRGGRGCRGGHPAARRGRDGRPRRRGSERGGGLLAERGGAGLGARARSRGSAPPPTRPWRRLGRSLPVTGLQPGPASIRVPDRQAQPRNGRPDPRACRGAQAIQFRAVDPAGNGQGVPTRPGRPVPGRSPPRPSGGPARRRPPRRR